MSDPHDNTQLCQQLQAALGTDASVSSTYVFGDLMWNADTRSAEWKEVGGSVTVDSPQSPRQLVLMIVRNEIRFWLTTDKDPYGSGATSGMGVVPSFRAAIRLCEEFIVRAVPVDQLTTAPTKVFTAP